MGVYIVLCLALYVGQDYVLFLPDKLPEHFKFRAGEEVEIQVDEGIYLNCINLKTPSPKGVILYLHGNKGSNRRCLYQASHFTGMDYDVFMPDYRGYGKSDGKITSESQLFKDVQKVYDHLKEIYGEEKIIVAGYSIGTGMASYLAAHNKPKHLFLNAPYVSIYDLKNRRIPIVPSFLVKYPLNNKEHLKDIDIPVTLFHGTADEVIPFESSEILAALSPDKIELIPLKNTGHRHSIFSDVFTDEMRARIKKYH